MMRSYLRRHVISTYLVVMVTLIAVLQILELEGVIR